MRLRDHLFAALCALAWTARPGCAQIAIVADAVGRAQADSGFSGVVLVAHRDSVLLLRAYGPRGAALVDTGSVFNIASMTKGFTAAAIALLQARRQLSMTDSIGRFLPGAPADKRSITIRQLVTHTAGLSDDYVTGGIAGRDDAVRAILGEPLKAPPGSRYEYQNNDYQLLAAVIEVVAGVTWERFIERELLRPAGMHRTGFQGGDWDHRGSNGMTSTARDVHRWIRAVQARRTLDSAVSDEIQRPLLFVRREPPFDIHYGYGSRVYARGAHVEEVMHSGSGDDQHTSIARAMRDGTIIIVLSNAGQHGNTTWASYVSQRILPRSIASQ